MQRSKLMVCTCALSHPAQEPNRKRQSEPSEPFLWEPQLEAYFSMCLLQLHSCAENPFPQRNCAELKLKLHELFHTQAEPHRTELGGPCPQHILFVIL